jgi:hypothetical protein
MTQTERKVIRAKVGLLELDKQLSNVTQACRVPGYSRESFYRFRDLYHRGGELALAEMTKAKPNLKKGVAPEIEAAVVRRRLTPESCRATWLRDGGRSVERRMIVFTPHARDVATVSQGKAERRWGAYRPRNRAIKRREAGG